MPKLLPIFIWSLAVASLAFLIGRWTAPASESATSEATDLVSIKNTAAIEPSSINQNTQSVSQQQTRPLIAETTKRGYAADYQQLQLLVALAATNPQLAMEKASQFKGAIKAKAQSAILDIWGANDPSAAWNWVEMFQPENNQAFIKLLEVMGAHESRTAVTFAEKFVVAHRELRKDAYQSLLTGITQAGAYNLAIEVVSRLEIESQTKAGLINLVIGAWAAYEPQAATQWAMTQSEELKTAIMEPLVESWSDADPQAAVNFVAGLSGSERETLLLPAFRKWLVGDAAAASSWLASAQLNKDFDPIISELATQPTNNNGQVKAALAWAGKIQNSELRFNTTVSILSAFKQKDSAAAAVYLHELSYLSDAERLQLKEDLAFEQ